MYILDHLSTKSYCDQSLSVVRRRLSCIVRRA